MTTKNRGNERLGIPSVDELVREIAQHETLMAESCGVPEDEENSYEDKTVFDYLIHADDFLAENFPSEYSRGWDSTDKANALFWTFKAYLQMTGRQDLQREVRFVGEFLRSSSYTSDPFTNIEFRTEKGDVHPFYKYRASAVARRQEGDVLEPEDDTVFEPLRRIRAYEGKWGEEWKPLFEQAERCIFQTGMRRGIC